MRDNEYALFSIGEPQEAADQASRSVDSTEAIYGLAVTRAYCVLGPSSRSFKGLSLYVVKKLIHFKWSSPEQDDAVGIKNQRRSSLSQHFSFRH